MTGDVLTKENGGIQAWILLSRLSQCELHLKGLKVKGIMQALHRDIPDTVGCSTVLKAYPRVLDYLDGLGMLSPEHEVLDCVNYQVLMSAPMLFPLFLDQGIVSGIDEVEANPVWVKAYQDGHLVIIRTVEPLRPQDRSIQMVKEA